MYNKNDNKIIYTAICDQLAIAKMQSASYS